MAAILSRPQSVKCILLRRFPARIAAEWRSNVISVKFELRVNETNPVERYSYRTNIVLVIGIFFAKLPLTWFIFFPEKHEWNFRYSFQWLIAGAYLILSTGHIFCVTGPLCGSPVDSPHKGQWRGALMVSLICIWTNGGANNRHAGDLRDHRAHYDASMIMIL